MTKIIKKHRGAEFGIQEYLDESNLKNIKIEEEQSKENEDDNDDDNLGVDSEDDTKFNDTVEDEPRNTIGIGGHLTRNIVKSR